ncbi:MAG: bacteriohemerythrin [Synergistaceae bacterium]|jgi:hemerythrin-like metal-binding protein|nr:bacteriohemerythrin [Synergistaceae bacterium]
MWKEEYRLGVETIDSQHQQLFEMVDNLLLVIDDSKNRDYKKECASAVNFLYDYTVKHFKFEEGYQASIGYKDIEAHKLQHKRFIITVENFAKKMTDTDYDMRTVKAFSGSLVAWLNYHVAETDQKIVGKNAAKDNESLLTCLESFSASAVNVIMTMMGLASEEIVRTMPPKMEFKGDISYKIGLVGDMIGKTVFQYSEKFARSIIKSLIAKDIDELDEIAYSAMAETSNIIGGKAAMMMSGDGKLCDITTPSLISDPLGQAVSTDGFNIKTNKGDMQILLLVD